jgi:hypothetical protein
VALVDGDVFIRRPVPGEKLTLDQDMWALPGWQVQRKPERAQRAEWQDVFSSEYQPLDPTKRNASMNVFKSPWTAPAGDSDWKIEGQMSYEYTGHARTTLRWDTGRWPVDDAYAYNEPGKAPRIYPTQVFPVSDINMSCGVEPLEGPVDLAAVVRTRQHEFRAEIQGTTVTLTMGPLGPETADGRHATNWTTIGSGNLRAPLAKGQVTNIEFWHVDQSLQVWVDGERIANGEYNWSPAERVKNTIGMTTEQVVAEWKTKSNNPLAKEQLYPVPAPSWEFSGPVRLYRVGMRRDISYQCPDRHGVLPARATHPLTTMTLTPDQFFVCGDNSPASLDARLWPDPDPWVAKVIDQTPGVVPRNLMIGKAFFVYFPSLITGESSSLPVPDFGRMRWIF